MNKLSLAWCGLLLGACTLPPDPAPGIVFSDAGTPAPDAGVEVEDAGTCGIRGRRCTTSADCCQGFCGDIGYAYTPDVGRCMDLLPDGEYCQDASWCVSGVCNNSQCGVPACVATGEPCSEDATCCDGFCPSSFVSYALEVGRCAARLPDGEYCQDASWCQTGVCTNSQCGNPPMCKADGELCQVGVETCCTGYCEWTTYVSGTCRPFTELGQACGVSEQCGSGLCGDGVCRTQECLAPSTNCYGDYECCEGFCTYDGLTYAPGVCSARLASGSACLRAEACQSLSCVDGVCQ